MRLLAEFIMQGRLQAVTVAILGSWIPVLSQAALALVTLRKGWKEGLLVTLAAILPSLVSIFAGETVGRTLVLATASVFAIAYCLALILRWSVSWSLTLTCAVVLSVLVALSFIGLSVNIEEDVASVYRQILDSSQQNNAEHASLLEERFSSLNRFMAAGVVAFWLCLSALPGVFFARWLQALLYNPGGFQTEFRSIRMNSKVALLFVVAASYCWYRSGEYFFWGNLFAVPLLVAGLALAHHMIARFAWGISTVIIMYVALLLFPPAALVVVLFGFTDAWVNYRDKFQSKQ